MKKKTKKKSSEALHRFNIKLPLAKHKKMNELRFKKQMNLQELYNFAVDELLRANNLL